MVDSIFNRQNDEFLLQCQVAQRREYSRAKKVARMKTILTLGFAAVSIVASALNIDWLSALSSLLAVVLIVFNKYSDTYIISHKKHAASLQQYIDVTLYSVALGGNVSEWGDIPSRTDLADTVSDTPIVDTSDFKNWYSDYSSLPETSQVFHCQCENIRWDHGLHKMFIRLQLILLGIVILIIFIAFFAVNPDFIKLICVLSWFTPVAEYSFSVHKEIKDSITLLQKLESFSNEIEKKLQTGSARTIRRDLIKLQYKIRERRELGYLIPDWFYQWHRKRQQEKEDKLAETITCLSKKNGE